MIYRLKKFKLKMKKKNLFFNFLQFILTITIICNACTIIIFMIPAASFYVYIFYSFVYYNIFVLWLQRPLKVGLKQIEQYIKKYEYTTRWELSVLRESSTNFPNWFIYLKWQKLIINSRKLNIMVNKMVVMSKQNLNLFLSIIDIRRK